MIKFPSHSKADQEGLLCVGGKLTPENLIHAYSNGIFPWPIENILAWFSPPKRAVLFFDELKISKSLIKEYRKSNFEIKMNTCFQEVIENCAISINRKQDGTWINKDIINSYIDLHKLGHAYSIECFQGDKLVGGVYGVNIKAVLSGESMFFTESGASKLSLLALILYAKDIGIEFLDCQQMSPLLKSFGARLVKRSSFLELINNALSKKIELKTSTELDNYLLNAIKT